MNKNVLILAGSPRKGGNSDILCEQFAAGAAQSLNNVETVYIRDLKIGYCTGCYACSRNDGRCVQKDSMAVILDKIIRADVIVMATPVYFYTMDAQMKTLIDRTVARYTEIKNKDFYFIATAAEGRRQALLKTFEGFRGFLDCLEGCVEKGALYGTSAWNIGDIKGSPVMAQAFEMGKAV